MNKKRLRDASIKIGASGGTEFNAQVESVQLNNETDDGDQIFTYAPGDAGEGREDVDPSWSLRLAGPSDWTEGGINDYMEDHDGETLPFTVIGHSTSADGWKVQWVGNLKCKATGFGGDNRTTDRYELVLPIVGKPTYSRPA